MKNLSLAFFVLCSSFAVQAVLPDGPLKPDVPKPSQVSGYAMGEWHWRHDQIQHYFEQLASQSPLAQLEVIGYSHERRPVLQLVISSEANMQRLAQIRQQNLAQSQGQTLAEDAPVVIWLGYGVHGNEPSAAHAAVSLAYHLTASNSAEVQRWLDEAVILIQPSLNPDGHDRFSHWVNMHRGATPVADPQHREHVEPWPNGRPNHYWFDLNRDWLLLQHPESQARIAQYYHWQPQVVGDFHEMGTNSSYFFQPGIPSRNYPLTPERNFELTRYLAEFHAAALDSKGELYYTEESFDDFYIGKGSTYPDVTGAVGILYEQASSRGHAQESIHGVLTFEKTIDNQLTTSLSTIRGAVEYRKELQQYQQAFFQLGQTESRQENNRGYMLTEAEDKTRLTSLLQLLQQHQIEVFALQRDWQDGQNSYKAGESYFVPLQQPQYRLLKAAFSTRKNFPDNTFYDVSSWTLPYAYNIEFTTVQRDPSRALASQPWQPTNRFAAVPEGDAYAYAFSWQDQSAPAMLQAVLASGLSVKMARGDFTAVTSEGEHAFKAGTVLIPAGLQQQNGWFQYLTEIQQSFGLQVHAIQTGLTSAGSDLGSHRFIPVHLPEVLLIAGPGINSTEAGELWYNLERLAGISPTMVEPDRLRRVDLKRYSHIVLPDGNYRQWGEQERDQLRSWIQDGGILWGQKRAVAWLAQHELLQAQVWHSNEMARLIPQHDLRYADQEALSAKQRIAGAIFEAELDLSHPLTFGLPRNRLPVFKNSTLLLQPSPLPFVNVALYSEQPHLAGYTAEEYVPRIAQGAVLLAHNLGQGRVIAMTDNPVFRGYFKGSSRLLVNAMYLGHAFRASASHEDEDDE
ncbi:M14 family zinc carboxypeptidase [Alkalimonas collagenimarina]|uniref:M14 family zinc carboxypeptidase n=1 Tax=Alkalimonas collagenimarina TaxID=400390 RepID=A0ABT9GX58_9GAMM|nr:M14 family zinc carboxypeptidase [Alkalimonas collagenimarina]MDP4535635.1 M14 family zinc carboxypeptidase [Alkalimonas collagenimarina]